MWKFNPFTGRIDYSDRASSYISDSAYGASWNGDTTHAPSKNAVYDKIESLATGAPVSAKYLVATANSSLSAEVDLGALTTGFLYGTVAAGVSTISSVATTGSGSVVLATSPTLVTPTLGVATATSINKVALTAPATSSTLTIADGKTLTASNTITLTATDGSTLAIGTGGTLGTAAYTAATAYQASHANLTSLAALSYVSASFVKMTAAGTFSLDTATYAPLTAPTFATSITGSYLTASEILITDGSKNIVSAPVATYPSLTELSYVKGLSSAIQTQLGAKLALAGGTMTGGLVLVAGTTTVEPLKMTAGTNLTTPVSGVFEYDGTNLYFTIA